MASLTAFEEFSALFEQGGMSVTAEQYAAFEKYAALLCEWNERMNLTAITDPEGIALKHFYDSVYPFTLLPPAEGESLIDVGTGAGFPSIPMGIMRPDLKLTLLDSLNKRVNFLTAVMSEIGLDGECIHGRAEEQGRFIKSGNPMRESFGIATARAVANLRELCEYCLPFVKVGGRFYALKGRDGENELKDAKAAIKTLGGEVELCKPYALPGGDERVLIVVRKAKRTPEKYPRNAGQMKKNPL